MRTDKTRELLLFYLCASCSVEILRSFMSLQRNILYGYHFATHHAFAGGIGQEGLTDCFPGDAGLRIEVFQEGFHSTPVRGDVGPQAVLQDRRPGFCRVTQGSTGFTTGAGPQENPPLHHVVQCPEAAGEKKGFDALLSSIFADAQSLELIEIKPQAAIDSTGFESTARSSHYAWRMGTRYRMRKWPKMTLVCHTSSHLIASALMSIGPSQDSPLLEETLLQAVWYLDIDCLLADGGYDSERNHVIAREAMGIRSTVINLNRRGRAPDHNIRRRKWAKTKYRRQMYRRFLKRVYRQRWQIESVISRLKRRLGSALRGHTDAAKERDCYMKILTHDLMVLAAAG